MSGKNIEKSEPSLPRRVPIAKLEKRTTRRLDDGSTVSVPVADPNDKHPFFKAPAGGCAICTGAEGDDRHWELIR